MTVSSANYSDTPDTKGQSHVCTATIDGQIMQNVDLRVPSFWSEQVNSWIAAGNAPAAYVAPPPPMTSLSFLQFMALFTAAEQAAIVGSTDTKTRLFVVMAAGAGSIGLADTEVVDGLNYLATTTTATPPGPGLITPARAAQILVNEAPPSS